MQIDIKKGDKSEKVLMVQEAMEKLGIDVGPLDGDYGPKTEYGVKEFKRRFLGDGDFVDAHTFAHMMFSSTAPIPKTPKEIPAGAFTIKKFIDIAMHDCEQGYAWNKGGLNSEYYRRFISPWVLNTRSYKRNYYPACAMGVHLWLKEAGMPLPYFYKGSSMALVSAFAKMGKALGIYEVETVDKKIPAGSLVIFISQNRYQHIGMVPKDVQAGEKTFYTCEVNRKRKVVYGTRSRDEIDAFIPLHTLEK